MYNNNFQDIHFGLAIKELMKKKKLSIDKDIAIKLNKTKQGVYKDYEKKDMYIKQIMEYLQIVDMNMCDFLQQLGLNNRERLNVVQEPDFEYKKMSQVNSEFKDKEIAMLKELLAEKERLIGVLLQK